MTILEVKYQGSAQFLWLKLMLWNLQFEFVSKPLKKLIKTPDCILTNSSGLLASPEEQYGTAECVGTCLLLTAPHQAAALSGCDCSDCSPWESEKK